MRALIVDDSRLARNELRRLLQEHPHLTVVGEAQNAEEALQLTEQLQPDVLFLDIQMPGKSGFELLEQLEQVPQVIFTTAYDTYAIKAFEYNALDYLLKPVQPQRLQVALSKLEEQQTNSKSVQEQPRDYLQEHDQVFVKDGEKCWFVKLSEIRLLEVCGNYTRVYFDAEKPLIQRTLNYMEQRLDPKVFFRASRQHMVNLKKVSRIEPWFSGSLKLYLQEGEEVEVSRRQAQRFKELMSF
ncbi:LytTR family DNA-binding domain-containing protein [uncultured Pontibacter sp.]|uniref:LytR/AlgR family response regulator transcription factor n=1 Tax=uncultured Pontibacter sp. TaxID=453356 RepID=UPI00261D25A3|nr:LytTR family DNA-binding domain-containing protein [uncultured Pontibacter sp.]